MPDSRLPTLKLMWVRDPGHSRKPRVRNSADLVRYLGWLKDEPSEVVVCVPLDTKHRPIGQLIVSRGTVQGAIVHPREVYRGAIMANATAIILAHNHPSGDPEPSDDDRLLFERLRDCGELLGIPCLDSIIVAADGCHSLAGAGA